MRVLKKMKGRRDQNCLRNTETIVGRAEESQEKEVRTVCVPITVQFFHFIPDLRQSHFYTRPTSLLYVT